MQEFLKVLLGTVSLIQFAAILFIAYLTAFTMLLMGTTKRDPSSIRTPFQFSWSFFVGDEIKRIVGNMLLIVLAIRFSQQWIPPQYNSFAGFLIGLSSNKLMPICIVLQEFVFELVKNKFSTVKPTV